MFQREIKFIYDFTLNKIKKMGDYVSYDQLVNADIHPAILQYISGEISFMIYADRRKLLKESMFDYSGKNVINLFRLIEDELKKTKRFDSELIARIVMYAVSFNVNHLVKPRWTLSRFIFDKEESKSIGEIKQLLNYIYYYDFLNSVLSNYFNKKKISVITKSDFEELLIKVDNIGLESQFLATIENHLNGVSDFFNIGAINRTRVPLTALELYLGEKNLTDYILLLKENFGDDLRIKAEQKDLLALLKNNPIKPVIVKERNLDSVKIPAPVIPDNLLIKKEEPQVNDIIEQEVLVSEKVDEQSILISENLKESEDETSRSKVVGNDIIDVNEENIESNYEDVSEKPIENIEIKVTEENYEIEDTSIIEETLSNDENISSLIEVENQTDNILEKEIDTTNIEELKEEENSKTETEIEELEVTDENEQYDFVEVLSDVVFEEMTENEKTDEVSNNEENNNTIEENAVVEKNIIEEVPEEEYQEEETIKINFDEDFEEQHDLEEESNLEKTEENYFSEIKQNEDIKEIYSSIDINELIENKDMSKIIEVIFNNDVEEFAETVEKLGMLQSEEEAILFLETYCNNIGINKGKKEVVMFEKIITEYFKNKG